MIYTASALTGAVIGFISVAIFAVILRKVAEKRPSEAIRALKALVSIVLGGGLADYVVFDWILSSGGALSYYLVGFAFVYLILGGWVFLDWLRTS